MYKKRNAKVRNRHLNLNLIRLYNKKASAAHRLNYNPICEIIPHRSMAINTYTSASFPYNQLYKTVIFLSTDH